MSARRSVSLPGYASERLDDLMGELRRDGTATRNVTRPDILAALIYAAPIEAASLDRLVRYGRMERMEDEGLAFGPDAGEHSRCGRSAVMLGWGKDSQ